MKVISETHGTVAVPKVLIPQNTDLNKWSVVACDQFTSDKNYWDNLSDYVGGEPSALRLILPECYLDCGDETSRRDAINTAMRKYYLGGVFFETEAFIAVKREFKSGKVRNGLIAAIDLADYDYRAGNKAKIRATEGTVEERLPPRVKIREQSLLELPHIMLLMDDPENIVFSAVEKACGETLYNFELNCGGGRINGSAVSDSAAVLNAFDKLYESMQKRFGDNLLLMVGDGNHSLAAAKKCYENAVKANDPTAELKRYALCEIVNIYDDGIDFEPIHRAVFGVDAKEFAARLNSKAKGKSNAAVKGGGKKYPVWLPDNPIDAVEFLQNFLNTDSLVLSGKTDYIHGDDVIEKLGERDDCAAVALAPVPKSGFTEYIIRHGVLPKKTFSMGQAEEKRYYLEARLIGKI